MSAIVASRRQLLRWMIAASCGLPLVGCAGPLVRSQSPDPEGYIADEAEDRVKLIGDLTGTWGFNYLKVESVALVTGLAGTGSDPPPSPQRQLLMTEMKSHNVDKPNQVLASGETAMVIIRGYLPPGAQQGDRFDVEVRIAPRTDTSSLRGGWLMQTRLRETEMLGSSVKTGHILATAQGPVIVDGVFQGGGDAMLETRGRVQSAGLAMKDRLMGLVVKSEFHSVKTASLIGTAINSRFHNNDRGGVQQGMAKPKDDNYIELRLHPRYKHNIARYIRVIRHIAVSENLTARANRLLLLDRMMMDPSTVANASLQLEAIGKDGIHILKKSLRSPDPEVRFYAAEALAYLDAKESAEVLKTAAIEEPAFRWHALTALASLEHVESLAVLSDLLHVPSAETRYGAFRALKTRNPKDHVVSGETFHQEFSLHAIVSTAEPMVHFTQSSKPEIVIFNDQLEIKPAGVLFAGKEIIVKRISPSELRISKFSSKPGQEDQVTVCSTRLDDCIRTVAGMGGHYEHVLQLVHEAKKQNAITGRVVVDAIPQSSRLLEKQLEEVVQNDASNRRRVSNPLPEMFSNRLAKAEQDEDAENDAVIKAAAEAEMQAEAAVEAKNKKTMWSRAMWWKD